MKKILCLILAMLMVLSLCAACGGDKEGEKTADAGTFQVGYGKAKIQPPDTHIVLTGGGDPNRYAENVLDYMYVTCVAIKDETGQTALFYANDLQSAADSWSIPCREFVNQKFGVPSERIFVSTTHCHSVPGLNYSSDANRKFCEVYEQGLIKCTEDAFADLSDAEVYTGVAIGKTAEGKPLNYVRHYTMNDGTYAGDNFGNWSSGISGHPYEADLEAQLIRFVREKDAKKDVLMVSWPSHSTFNGTTALRDLSVDYPGPTRDHIEANSNCLVAMFVGAAGDTEPDTLIPAENHYLNYREYGSALGQAIVDALPSTTKIESGEYKFVETTYTTESNIYTDSDRLTVARDVYDYFQANGQAEGTTYAKSKGFMSPYEARAYLQRAALPETSSITISALSFGDLSFAVVPYEMFSQSGAAIKTQSPFPMTFILGYTNGSNGYISTPLGYEYNDNVGCYEAYSSKWPKGTAEKLVDEYLTLLNQLK